MNIIIMNLELYQVLSSIQLIHKLEQEHDELDKNMMNYKMNNMN
jgi:hypothetical protein